MRTVCWMWIALSSFLPMATFAGIAAARALFECGRGKVALDCLDDLVRNAKDASVRRYANEIARRIRHTIRLDDRPRAFR
ncbi:MAG TPA: hypothetical protein VMV69_29225 [Pirellulales bacterium]|nr:hypothetical protein [Pirellulales bacterium]